MPNNGIPVEKKARGKILDRIWSRIWRQAGGRPVVDCFLQIGTGCIVEYGYTDTRIAEGQELFNRTESARSTQLKAIAAKDQKFRDATELKNKAYDKLLAWWKKFSTVVDVAVEENPQLKEQISIVTPTTK